MGVSKGLIIGLGSVIALIGASMAVAIGPDDWLDSRETVANSDGQAAVVTEYGLISQRTPMRIRAKAADGEVFIGLGHAINVDDYVAHSSVTTITGFTPVGLSSKSIASAAELPSSAPAQLDFWRQTATGTASQELSGNFGGQPMEVLISTPDGHPTDLTVSLGIKLPGSFASGLAVAGIGLALVAAGLFVGRGRRPDQQGGTPVPVPASGLPPTYGPPPMAPPSFPPPPPPPSPGPMLKRWAALGLTGAVLMASAGCSGTPLPDPLADPPPKRSELTIDPSAGLDLKAFAADYTQRANKAVKASMNPSYSAAEWQNAECEPNLGVDRMEAAEYRVQNYIWHAASDTSTTTIRSVFSSPAKQYPLRLLAVGTVSWGGTDALTPQYQLYVRKNSYTPWLRSSVSIAMSADAEPVQPGTTAVTADAEKAGQAAAEQFVSMLRTGKSTGLSLPKEITKWRMDTYGKSLWSIKIDAKLLPENVVTVPAADGTITQVAVSYNITYTAPPGKHMYWNASQAKIYRQPGGFHQLTQQRTLSAAIQIKNGEAAVVAWRSRDILP